MPDIYGPFDPDLDVNGDPIPGTGVWAEDEWYDFAPLWAPSGVVGSAASATSPSAGSLGLTVSGMDISLSLGRAWVYGAGYKRTSTPWTATIPANTSSNPRMDALVLRRDRGTGKALPTVLQGTPAATPVAPTRQFSESGQWDLPLFTFIVPANSGAPLNTVVDNRVWVDTQSSNYAVFSSGAALPVQTAYTAADLALTVSTTAPADVGLNTASLTVGTYLVDVLLSASSGSLYFRLFRDTTNVTGRLGFFGPVNTTSMSFNPNVAVGAVINSGSQAWVSIKGMVVLTAAKVANLDVSASAASNLYRGSYLTMTKVA